MAVNMHYFKPVLTDPVALAVSIMPTSRHAFPQWISLVESAQPAVVEWRLDYFLEDLDPLAPSFPMTWQYIVHEAMTYLAGWPILLTYRTQAQGGRGSYNQKQYLALMKVLCRYPGGATWLDLEATLPVSYGDALLSLAHQAGLTTMLSWHSFGPASGVKAWLDQLRVLGATKADYLKLAVLVDNHAQTQDLLLATQRAKEELRRPLVTMAMGPAGQVSRLNGYRYGSDLTFAALNPQTTGSAPGQLTVSAMRAYWQGQ